MAEYTLLNRERQMASTEVEGWKAEVYRLRKENDAQREEIARLKAEIEDLRQQIPAPPPDWHS